MQNNPYDFGNPIGNFYQAYQQAFIPQQMRQEQQINALKQAYMQQQMQYEPQINAEKLKQIQLENQYAPQLNEQKMKMLQLQNKGLLTTNDIESEKLRQAQMDMQRRQAFMKMLQGSNNESSNEENNNNSSIPNYQNLQTSNSNYNLDNMDAIWANPQMRAMYGDYLKDMGIQGKQQIFNNPTTGEVIKVDTLPSGKINTTVIPAGKNPYERSFETEQGKNEASILNTMNQNDVVYQQNSDDLHLINSVLGDPKLESIMGPVWQSKLTNLAGKKEYQELLGAINVAAGDYYNRMLNMSKGNPSNFDAIQLLKTKIDTDKDSLGVAVGKARALNIINLTSQKRSELAQNFVSQGMKPSEAQRQAAKQIPLDSSKKEVDALVQGKQLMISPDGKLVSVPFEMVDEAIANRGSIYGR